MDKIKSGLKQHTKGGSNSSSAEIKSTHAESTGQKLIRVTGLKDKNEEVKKKVEHRTEKWNGLYDININANQSSQ